MASRAPKPPARRSTPPARPRTNRKLYRRVRLLTRDQYAEIVDQLVARHGAPEPFAAEWALAALVDVLTEKQKLLQHPHGGNLLTIAQHFAVAAQREKSK